MTTFLLAAITATFALQSAPAASAETESASLPAITSLDELPLQESAGMRCSVAFAIVGRWQKQGDARGGDYPDMEAEGGKEFFVRSFVPLMEEREMTPDQLSELVLHEIDELSGSEGEAQVVAMMPACLLMKQSAGL